VEKQSANDITSLKMSIVKKALQVISPVAVLT